MARLRDKESGCPWDVEQSHKTLKKYLVEEAYELIDALDDGDDEKIIEELGDVLLQVIFHCQIATEEERFDLERVARRCCEKLIHRHPHVFGDGKLDNADAVLKQWEKIKRKEPGNHDRHSALDGVPKLLPALLQAEQLQKKAARVGFDWPSLDGVYSKIEEELDELKLSLKNGDSENFREELGDVLFSVVNLARFKGDSAEDLLRSTIQKFYKRFRYMEHRVNESGKEMEDVSLLELETIWQTSKTNVG